MLLTVKDACELHPMALEYSMSEQVENLSDVIGATAANADEFFAKNYVTRGMETLLSQGLLRLGGKSDQAVFELKQAMGGGKTHSMIALGLLARDGGLRAKIVPEISREAAFGDAKLVAVNGRLGFEETFVWGEIANQLGKGAQFSRFWRDGAKAPSEKDWIELIGDEPTLILLDELPPYFDYAVTRVVGNGNLAQVTTYALSNLLSAALKLKRCCIVVSNLSGSYEGASRQLRQAIRNFEQEANRQARAVTPVELASQEIYEILRKRLFKKLPAKSVIDSVAAAYASALSEAVKSKSIAKSAEQIAEEIHGAYPFHPSVKHVIALFKENESYRQTRGLMQFVSKMIKSAWKSPVNNVYLIGCQHLNLNLMDVREEINRISNLQGAIAHDVAADGASVAETVDGNHQNDAATQCAALLLTGSLSESVDAVKGFAKQQLLEYLIAPGRTVIEFQDAFDALKADAWYLHRKDNDTYYFSNVENLRKRIENRAISAPQPKIDQEMRRRLEAIFRPETRIAYQEVHALPKIDEINLNGPRVCLVLSPDSKAPPTEAQEFWKSVTEKNNFCVVTGDGSSLGSLEDKTRRIWAIARVLEETGGDRSPHKSELEEEAEQAELDFNSTVVSLFNRVYYPTKSGLTAAKLSMTYAGNQFKGEEQIEKALADLGVSKLYRSVEENADMLMGRAEETLWPAGGDRRAPWRDVSSRALTNERWPWLPSKGLEALRKIAEGRGRWRYSEEGYIEKGPFPKAKTRVIVAERDYKEESGTATLEVLARDAGPRGRVHYSKDANVTAESPCVTDTIFETDETVLWFLAIDPDGEHEKGDVKRWENRLHVTHQPVQLPGGKRRVELTVKPRGVVRWNLTGANPKEGTVYTGPIEIPGDAETALYVYAEDQGVGSARTFPIPRADQKGPIIDKKKPARLRKKLDFRGSTETYGALANLEAVQARFSGGVSLTVGEGAKAVSMRFGSETSIQGTIVRKFIDEAREALGNPTADVVLRLEDVKFPSGHDLETFAEKQRVDVGAGEVEQQ
ncbi:MAG: anti-phage-associated DUF499 domain-containing protein [Bryobacteraceae bacterium]|nr:anti-phage-associated DUF499 domain-containing protein [Bryobacteraceae bacterium]